MHSKLRLLELKNSKYKTKHLFSKNYSRFLEVANFRFLVNFRFLTLQSLE